jgi:hypothetical protein
VALFGGYTGADACKRLSANHRMIGSFSRALAEDLWHTMSDATFNAPLAKSIDEIYRASTVKILMPAARGDADGGGKPLTAKRDPKAGLTAAIQGRG